MNSETMERAVGRRHLTAVVVDDDPLARRLIRGTLDAAEVDVLGEGSTGSDAVELARRLHPDVVLMDIVMPGMDGIAATRAILDADPEQTVVLLTVTHTADMAIVALRVGAAGYLTKDLNVEALPRALARAMDGEPALSRRTAMRLIEYLRAANSGLSVRPVHSPLTHREWEVAELLGERRTNEEIAHELAISADTVRSHVKSILRKLGVSSRRDVVAALRRLDESPTDG